MGHYNYGSALCAGFEYLLSRDKDVFVIGQGLWSPWYVGNSMTELDVKFGTDRIIDTPVSESAVTGAAVGAAIAGKKPIVVHPRMDFLLYAMDAIVNQAAKWRHMFGGQAQAGVTIRAIINRGGEQGAQHSQALHSWFAHIPGLKVVMPATVQDARDLLVASVLSPDPVVFIDDRSLYDQEDELSDIQDPLDLSQIEPNILREGTDITLAAAGYSVKQCLDAADILKAHGLTTDVVDMRVLSSQNAEPLINSIRKTGRLLAVDGGWSPCGFSAELISLASETLFPHEWRSRPRRLTLPFTPAPTSSVLEHIYYLNDQKIAEFAKSIVVEK